MNHYCSIIIFIVASVQMSIGGHLYGESLAPAEYTYAAGSPYTKLTAYSSPLIPDPYVKSYSASPFAVGARYTAFDGAHFPAGYANKFAAHSPLSYAAASYQGISPYSSPFLGHSIGAYNSFPLEGYRPYVGSFRSPFGGYAAPLAGRGVYSSFGQNISPLASW